MQSQLTKVELFGVLTQLPGYDELETRRQVQLHVRRNRKEGTKTFILSCQTSGKILMMFNILDTKKEVDDNNSSNPAT